MQKWEYLEVHILYGELAGVQIFPSKGKPVLTTNKETADATKYLDSLGVDGWEMVSAVNVANSAAVRFYFKRQLTNK